MLQRKIYRWGIKVVGTAGFETRRLKLYQSIRDPEDIDPREVKVLLEIIGWGPAQVHRRGIVTLEITSFQL